MNAITSIDPRANSGHNLLDPSDLGLFTDTNVRPFGFRHRLALELPLTLTDIAALNDRLPDGDAFKSWQNGVTQIEDGWRTRPSERLTLADTIAGIETNHSLVVLKHIEQDSVVGPALRNLLQEIFDYSSSRFRKDVILGECLVFLNSPGRKTAYHFDLEASFLLQIAGTKTVHAWPCGNLQVVAESEVEAYCGAGNLSAAVYKPDLQKLAQTYLLEPGDGVHFPSLGPHWVQNGDTVSISINVNYDLHSLHGSLRPILALNHRLEKLGLRPRKPGASLLSDKAKATAWTVARNAKTLARRIIARRRNGEGYPVWMPEHRIG